MIFQFLTTESTEATEMEEWNDLSGRIIGAAISVHSELGSGLLESAYERCLLIEIKQLEIPVECQVDLAINDRGIRVPAAYWIDMWVDRKVILEGKAVQHLESIHEAQPLSYLKLTGCRLGLLMNFNVKRIRDGIKRMGALKIFPSVFSVLSVVK